MSDAAADGADAASPIGAPDGHSRSMDSLAGGLDDLGLGPDGLGVGEGADAGVGVAAGSFGSDGAGTAVPGRAGDPSVDGRAEDRAEPATLREV